MSRIQTGMYGYDTDVAPGCGAIEMPMTEVFFSPDMPPGRIESRVFRVSPGDVRLISAYNLAPDMPIYLNRVVTGSTAFPSGVPCPSTGTGLSTVSTNVIVYKERMTLGTVDAWKLVNSSTGESKLQMLLAIPGEYTLELSDEELLSTGLLFVNGLSWKFSLTTGIPFAYYPAG